MSIQPKVLNIQKLVLGATLVASIVSCTSAAVRSELIYSLANIQQVVSANIPGGLDGTSVNQREYFSKPFRLPSRYFSDTEVSGKGLPLKRGKVKVQILGDRRPYDLKVFAYMQSLYDERDPKNPKYDTGAVDKALSNDIADKFLDILAKGQKNRNLIDDFRPF